MIALHQRRAQARRTRRLRRIGTWVLALGGALVLAVGLPWLVWRGPYLLDKGYINTATLGEASGSATLITGLRTALVACAAAIGAGVALVYTIRNYRLTRRGQVTDRFTKALERLGSNHRYVRIGGVLALEQIVQDAPEQATHAAQVLGHFVRDRAPARPGPPNAPDGKPTTTDTLLPMPLEADVQVALTALTRPKSRTHVDDFERLYLGTLHLPGALLDGADLTGAKLVGTNLTDARLFTANLMGADLSQADLTGADLSQADLTGADLSQADLTGANLVGADLTGANLREANLTSVNLREAILTGASLVGADLTDAYLAHADLTGADLSQADLTRANLRVANLNGASLPGANLFGANLGTVVGWTTEQVRYASVSAETVLPPGLRMDGGPSTT
ncbi:pentapeptide repeat-containing protein [Streptomyces canus]|uniref:pentapeptide repeat-containing protein n=1 Tax=Streptomyces canus TaxID=58343 RepID=UPI003251B5D1